MIWIIGANKNKMIMLSVYVHYMHVINV